MNGSENRVIKSVPPSAVVAEMRVFRLSKILFNMTVAIAVINILALLSSIIAPITYAFVLIAVLLFVLLAILLMTVFTFGIVFAIPDGPVQKLWGFLTRFTDSGESVMNVTMILFNSSKWLSLIGIILSVLSALFICLSKSSTFKAAKVTLLVFLTVIFGAVFAFQLITGGMQMV